MFKSLLKLQQRRRRRPHRQRDHDVGRPAAGDLSGSASGATRFIEAGRANASARFPASSAPRCRPTCRCAGSGRATRMDGPRRRAAASACASSASIRTTSPRSTSRCWPAAASPPDDRAGAPRVAIVNEALAAQAGGALQDRRSGRRSSGESSRLVRPPYENRGQPGKVEDIEIVGVIRNERVNDLESPTPEVVVRLAAAVTAPRDQADRPHARASRRPRCRPSARR